MKVRLTANKTSMPIWIIIMSSRKTFDHETKCGRRIVWLKSVPTGVALIIVRLHVDTQNRICLKEHIWDRLPAPIKYKAVLDFGIAVRRHEFFAAVSKNDFV